MKASEKSIKNYLNNYYIINRNSNNKPNEYIDAIKKYKNTRTKLMYMNSILSLYELGNSMLPKNTYDEIKQYKQKLQTQLIKDIEDNNMANQKQNDIVRDITFQDIKDVLYRLNDLKYSSIRDLENYILVYLLVKIPARNDFRKLKIIYDIDAISNIPENYILLNDNPKIILLDFKTAKKYIRKDFEINDNDLIDDIIKLKNNDNREYLFINRKNKALHSSDFTKRLNSIFKTYLKIEFSTTIFRKIYLTSKYQNVLEEMQKDANLLCHQLSTAVKYYIKH